MSYIDGLVAPVRADNRQAYLDLATRSAAIFKRHGAIGVREAWGDDVPAGKLTSFPLAVQLQEGEVVVFSWIEWPDKAARDAGWAKVMADPEMKPGADMPFDGKRMIYGGFATILNV